MRTGERKPDQHGNWYRLHPQSQQTIQQLLAVRTSLDNRGLAYADGFFTTMAVIDGEVLWFDYHEQRLDNHARALAFNLPENLALSIKSHAKQLQQGMMKVVVTRAKQSLRGYAFSDNAAGHACEIWLKSTSMDIANHTYIMLPNGHSIATQAPTRAICLTSQLACLPPTLAGLKSLNRLDNVLASGELERLKSTTLNHESQPSNVAIGEGLVRDMTGDWVEGTMSNVFYQLATAQLSSAIKDNNHHHIDADQASKTTYLSSGQWYTPAMTQSGVAGVMRQVIIDSLSTTKNPVIIRPLIDSDLPNVSQLFFSNAVRGIMPASSLTLLNGEKVRFN